MCNYINSKLSDMGSSYSQQTNKPQTSKEMPGKVATTVNKYNVTRIPVVLFSDLRKLLTACLCAVSGRICYRFFKIVSQIERGKMDHHHITLI